MTNGETAVAAEPSVNEALSLGSRFKKRNLDRRDGSSAPPPSPQLTDRRQRPWPSRRVVLLSRTVRGHRIVSGRGDPLRNVAPSLRDG